ncbi:MAG: glycosyltransferase family A protein [Patescibacteria group bacterium]|nr:glycosyltransferase family A protein [Patescibacteria group bacterium]
MSVIIPTYQHAGEIGKCLASVLASDFRDFEVIVVNDGSTDDTDEAVRPYLERVNYVKQEHRGGNATRNHGFDLSRGEYVIFCDADVVMRPDMLVQMLDALNKHPEASYAYSSFHYGWTTFVARPFDAAALRKNNYIMTTSLIRRARFPRFDEAIRRLQDWDLWLTMLEQGRVGVAIPEVLFRIIPHRGGISAWLPKFAYRLPWSRIGFMPRRVRRYLDAEAVIKKKHRLS